MIEVAHGQIPESILVTEPLQPRVTSIVRRYMIEPANRAALVAGPVGDPGQDPHARVIDAFQRSWRSLRSAEKRTSLVNTFVRAQAFDTKDPTTRQMQAAARVMLAIAPIKGQDEIRKGATETFLEIADNVRRKTSRHVLQSVRQTGEILLHSYPTRESTVLEDEQRLRTAQFKLVQREAGLLDEPLEMPDNTRLADIVSRFLIDPVSRASLRAESGRETETTPKAQLFEAYRQIWRSLQFDEPARIDLVKTLVGIQTIKPKYWKTPQVQYAARELLAYTPMDGNVREAAANRFSEIVESLPEDTSPSVREALERTGIVLLKSYPARGRAMSDDESRLGGAVFKLVEKAAEERGDPFEMPDFTGLESVSTSRLLHEPQPLSGEQEGLVRRYQTAATEEEPQALEEAVIALHEGRTTTQIATTLGVDRLIMRRVIERLTGEGRIASRASDVKQFRAEVAKRRRIVVTLDTMGMRPALISDVTGFGLDSVLDDRKNSWAEVWRPNELTQRYIDGILNNPVKIALAIELVRRKDEPPTATDLDKLFVKLQDDRDDRYKMSEGQPRNFVENSLITFGFAEKIPATSESGAYYAPTAEAEAGLALYGHMLALSEQIADRDPTMSLHDYLSTTNVPGDAQRSPSTNLQLYSELVRLWKAKALPVRSEDMRNLTGHPRDLGERLFHLHESGVLNYRSAEADTPLKHPFERLEKSELSISKRQGEILSKLVNMIKRFERGEKRFIEEGLIHVNEIMGSPERMVKILRPMETRRVVGPEAYNAMILDVFDTAEGGVTVRDISNRVKGLKLPYARTLIKGLAERGEIIETESRTAKRYRRATEEERVARAAEEICEE